MNRSEVAQLYHQIEVQLEAMRRGMSGFATGRSRHDFIRAHMDNVGGCQDALSRYVGEDAADQVIYSLYIEVMEREY
jgi:ABC-type Fe2+-enterobactin transport system substrate-binding protein